MRYKKYLTEDVEGQRKRDYYQIITYMGMYYDKYPTQERLDTWHDRYVRV